MTDCTASIDDLQFDIPITTIGIKGPCECGSVLSYECNGAATCLDDCDLEARLAECRSCVDLFDTCCMPECENGTYLRIKNCNDCANKYELVDACEIFNEIVNSDKCDFELDLQCEDLENLFSVCDDLANPDPSLTTADNTTIDGFSIKCVGGKLQLCGQLPSKFTCEDRFDCIEVGSFLCPQQTCAEVLDSIKCENEEDCPECEECEGDDCERFQLEFCPETKVIRPIQDRQKLECNRNARFKGSLTGGPMHIQQPTSTDAIYYISSVALPVNTLGPTSPIDRVGSSTRGNVVYGLQDQVPPCWSHCNKNMIRSGNGFVQYATAGTEYVHFEFQAEINKAVHAARMGLMLIPCGETEGKLITQFKTGAPVANFYQKPEDCEFPAELECLIGGLCSKDYGQPNSPDLFFGTTGCNDATTSFQGPLDSTVAGTYSLGRYVEALSFNGGTQVDVKPGDIIVPVVLLSTATTGDCDAMNTPFEGMFSITGEGSTQGGSKFSSHFGSYGITDSYERECLNKQYGIAALNSEGEGAIACNTIGNCCEPIVQPTEECLTPGEYNEVEPPVFEEPCTINGPEDCAEGTFYVPLGDDGTCGVCSPNEGLPGTGGS